MEEQSQSELEKLKSEREEYLNGWKRAKADLINFQKEESRRFEDVARFATAGLVKELVTVLDSFDLALGAMEKEGRGDKGVVMIKGQLEEALKRNGVEKIRAEIGKPFDPNFQEAVAEADSDHPPGSVIEIVTPGYALQGKVIRPVRVKISRGQILNT